MGSGIPGGHKTAIPRKPPRRLARKKDGKKKGKEKEHEGCFGISISSRRLMNGIEVYLYLTINRPGESVHLCVGREKKKRFLLDLLPSFLGAIVQKALRLKVMCIYGVMMEREDAQSLPTRNEKVLGTNFRVVFDKNPNVPRHLRSILAYLKENNGWRSWRKRAAAAFPRRRFACLDFQFFLSFYSPRFLSLSRAFLIYFLALSACVRIQRYGVLAGDFQPSSSTVSIYRFVNILCLGQQGLSFRPVLFFLSLSLSLPNILDSLVSFSAMMSSY